MHAVARLPIRPGVVVPAPEPVVTSPPPAATAPPGATPEPPAGPPPVVTPIASPPPTEPLPRPAPAPLNRKPPSSTGGLDDLFGMGASGENTRIRMPRPEAEGDTPRPKKAMVTSPEELARLGLDRRPPPPKPTGDTEK